MLNDPFLSDLNNNLMTQGLTFVAFFCVGHVFLPCSFEIGCILVNLTAKSLGKMVFDARNWGGVGLTPENSMRQCRGGFQKEMP